MYIDGEELEGEVPQKIFELPHLYELHINGEGLRLELSDALESRILSGASVTLSVGSVTGCLSDLAHLLGLSIYSTAGDGSYPQICDSVHEGDLDVLREIFNEWGHYGSLNNWLTRAPVHEWDGITLDRNGRVVDLDIWGSKDDPRKTDLLPEAIGRLTALQFLGLSSQEIEGEIPDWIGDLTQLRILYLSNNDFFGEIPHWIANLTQLQELNLSNNNLSGEVPSFLSSMPELLQIDLRGNDLSGCLPEPAPRPEPLSRGGSHFVGPDGELEKQMVIPYLSGVEYCP